MVQPAGPVEPSKASPGASDGFQPFEDFDLVRAVVLAAILGGRALMAVGAVLKVGGVARRAVLLFGPYIPFEIHTRIGMMT